MKYTFTLHEDAWLRHGPVYAGGQITGYRVGGMPDGRTARIANFGAPERYEWRIMRINADNTQSDWSDPTTALRTHWLLYSETMNRF
jgi:hypothetical protein